MIRWVDPYPLQSCMALSKPVLPLSANIISVEKPGVIAVCGPSATKNSMFVYSLLQYINQNNKTIIYVIENILSVLMRHKNSVVVQCEVGTDIESMEVGINNAALFNPGIMYVGDIRPSNNYPGITNAVENGALVIISSVLADGNEIIEKYYPKMINEKSLPDMISGIFIVEPGKDNKLAVIYENVVR